MDQSHLLLEVLQGEKEGKAEEEGGGGEGGGRGGGGGRGKEGQLEVCELLRSHNGTSFLQTSILCVLE